MKINKKLMLMVATVGSVVSGLVISASAAAPSIVSNFTGETPAVDLNAVFGEVVALVPYVLPAIIAFIALRKGIQFVKSALQGA